MRNKNNLINIATYTILGMTSTILPPYSSSFSNEPSPVESQSVNNSLINPSPAQTLSGIITEEIPPLPSNFLQNILHSNTNNFNTYHLTPLEKCILQLDYDSQPHGRFVPLSQRDHFAITRPRNSYGHRALTSTLDRAACIMYNQYKTPLRVNDISRQHGGRLYPHKSHRRGLDADIGMYAYNKQDGYYTTNASLKHRSESYKDFNNPQALEANWQFIKSLTSGPSEIQYIFWDRSLIKHLKQHVLTSHSVEEWKKHGKYFFHEPGHTTHYHIRIKTPELKKTT